ncbi:hypothetical protein NSQ93_10655 [Bacillus sp. FSL W8-0445]|nr:MULTISPECIES: hypothetical protein [Bacillus]MBJ7885851.1 hypothetical protein [Bacillaceae bacterium HSR45]MDP4082303.1 hypothetical protein [Bacillota bacterium]AXF89999.1 hypothetical protein BLDA23_17640 [Bacillus licheniformis]AYC53017.1 hypothetical protein C7M53_17520 [Bacillus licheniformis]AZN78274.1 hypothetical protein CXG95_03820 [Bacillus licheniformis]
MKILNFFLIAGVCFLFSGCHSVEKTESQKKETASPSSDERYNDEQEGITGPGTETVSYGLYEMNGKLLDTSNIGHKDGKKYKKVLSFSHYVSVKRNYSLIILSDFQAIPFKADNKKYSESYTFEMNENTVRKIKLEFEIPHNHSELSLLIIPEAEFQLETKNLDIISGLQEIFTLRYVQNTPNSNQKDYLHPLQTTDELTGEEAFLTSHPQGSEILYKVKSNKKAFLQVFNPHNRPLDYAIIAFSGNKQVKFNKQTVSYISVKKGSTNIYEVNIPQVREKENYQIVLFPSPYKTGKIEEGINNRSYSTLRTLIEP